MGDMLLEMEQHSGLISLSMSPFHMSPQGSPQAAGQQPPQQQPQPHYGSSAYSSCAQSSPSPMCHQPQSQSQQQQQQMSAHNQVAQSQGMSSFEAAFFDSAPLEDHRCPVCGHKNTVTSGYQCAMQGLLTCENCKNFFKRNGSPCGNKKVYTCLFSDRKSVV